MEPCQIINQAVMNQPGKARRGKVAAFWKYFNEDMGTFGVTYQTVSNWAAGRYNPDRRLMRYAMAVYPEGDPRHELAAQLVGED